MLDTDLAQLYGVPTKRLNEAVKRNLSRFPETFMFHLTIKKSFDAVSLIPLGTNFAGHVRIEAGNLWPY